MTEGILNKILKEERGFDSTKIFPSKAVTEQTYSKEEEKKFKLGEQHYKVTKSFYPVSGSPNTFSVTDLLKLYLLHYRYITKAQFQNIFPEMSKNFIATVCSRDKDISYEKLKSEQISYYYLTDPGYTKIRSAYPEEYLKAARIPAKTGNLPVEKRASHEIHIRDGIYAVLSTDSFMPPDWYTSIDLIENVSPYLSIKSATEESSGKPKATEKNTVKADAIMVFEDNASIILEEDCCTEHSMILANKITAYGNYFSSIRRNDITTGNAANTKLIFNIIGPNEAVKKFTNNTADKGLRTTLEDIVKGYDLIQANSLKEYYELVCDKSASAGPRKFAYLNQKELLEEYIKNNLQLSHGIQALKDFVKNRQDKAVPSSEGSRKRCEQIQNMLKESYSNNDDWKRAINDGISVTVTDNFEKDAYYLCPYESGLMDNIRSMIESEYLGSRTRKERSVPAPQGIGGVVKNLITVTSSLNGKENAVRERYFVSEISADYAEYLRMKKLLISYSGQYGKNTHFIFLVASEKDARRFVNDTGCVEQFCHPDDVTEPKPEYGTTIRFIDYSKCENGDLRAFVPRKDGKIVEAEEL